MSEFNFNNEFEPIGRSVIKSVLETDYGPDCSFDGIGGHGPQDHHGGTHDQVVLFNKGRKESHEIFRFFEDI